MLEAAGALSSAAAVTAAVVLGARLWRGAPYSVGYSLHAVTNAAVIVCLAATVALAWSGARIRPAAARTAAAYVLTAALPTLAYGIPLARTPLYYGGLHLDQQFRTQYLLRLTESPALSDMNYAGLPPYYPAGWFWPAGRIADITGIPAWQFMKPWSLLTFAVAATVALYLWRRIQPTVALPLTTVTVLAVLFTSHQEPYSGALAILAPPMAVIAWHALRTGRRGALATTAIALGITVATYTLYAAVAILTLIVMAAVARTTRRSAVKRLAAVAGGAALIGLVVWLPYLIAWLRSPASAAGAAQEYLPTAGAAAWLSQFEATPLGVTTAVGTVWLLLRLRTDRGAQALGITVGVAYLWTFLSMLAAAAGTTLLGFRVIPILYATLGAAATLAAAELVRRHSLPRYAIAAGALLIAVALAQQGTWQLRSDGAKAYTDVACDGRRADGRPAGAQAYLPRVDAAIREMTRTAPRDTVVLPTDFTLLSCFGYRGFTSYIAQYANPLAGETRRKQLVEEWSRARTPAQLTAALDASPARPPTVFVFETSGTRTLRLDVTRDTFPADPNTGWSHLDFARSAFAGPGFEARRVGPYTVVARTGQENR